MHIFSLEVVTFFRRAAAAAESENLNRPLKAAEFHQWPLQEQADSDVTNIDSQACEETVAVETVIHVA